MNLKIITLSERSQILPEIKYCIFSFIQNSRGEKTNLQCQKSNKWFPEDVERESERD